MKTLSQLPQQTALFLALIAAFPAPALADEEVDRLILPESRISFGLGSVHGDNQRFGMYTGKTKDEGQILGDVSVIRLDKETGTWIRVEGRDLGLSTRELRVEHEKQGDFKYFVDYTQTPRVSPYAVYTGVTGVGEATVNVPVLNGPAGVGTQTAAGKTEIKTERYKTTLGFVKALGQQFEFRANFQSEEKQGVRLFGRGATGGTGGQEFLPEPIDSLTRQLDLTLNYVADGLQLSGGYYGSSYTNKNSALLITGGAAGFTGGNLNNPIALPPDNYAHQLNFAAAYDVTKTTRATMKYSFMKNVQNDKFILDPVRSAPINSALAAGTPSNANDSGRTDLGGRVDTTLLQFGLTSRPTKELSIVANLRYEDRDDATAVVQYISINPAGLATASTDGFNEPRSLNTVSGKLEASYILPAGLRATGGMDYERKKRTVSGVRVVGFRERTEEVTWRGELKRSMFDAVSGTLSYSVANRTGSEFNNLFRLDGTTPYPNGGVTPAGLLQPIYIADRDRRKLKALVDWAPVEALSLQFAIEETNDRYGQRGRINSIQDLGVGSGGSSLYSVDAAYDLSDKWKLTGYASRFSTDTTQTTRTGANVWTATMRSEGVNIGMGVKGKVGAKFDVGGDLLFAEDLNEYRNTSTVATIGSLPDINSVQTTFKLFGSYAWDKATTIKVDYVHDRRKTNDWTWNGAGNPYIYSDGTRLIQNPNEKTSFIGVSANYTFR